MSRSAAGTKHFWRNRMACRTVAKTSLVHRFTQVLLNPASKEEKSAKEEDLEAAPPPSLKLTSLRMRLEMDVERLSERLQQETDLHSALANASARTAGAFATFPHNLPLDAQELLTDVAMLEIAVSSLEEQLTGLKKQIRHERNERLHNASGQTTSPLKSEGFSLPGSLKDLSCGARDLTESASSFESNSEGLLAPVSANGSSESTGQGSMHLENCVQQRTYTSETMSLAEENVDSPVDSWQSFKNLNERITHETPARSTPNVDVNVDSLPEQDHKNKLERRIENWQGDGNALDEGFSETAFTPGERMADNEAQVWNQPRRSDKHNIGPRISNNVEYKSMWRAPNKLSQEMVSCMIGIYCHLADPSDVMSRKQTISDNVPSPSSPFGHVTSSSFSSLSDLSNMSSARSPPYEPKFKDEQDMHSNVDPYSTREKAGWGDIGTYSAAFEASWISVGKEQLEFAAESLKLFRCLVEQLSKVDAMSLEHREKLAFWINVYNALMMHAYLAYGVPKNDVKYFALMQKAAYTVGGQSFNAMAIEHVLLRGRAPSYRPQIALLLALHKLKIPEGASKFAISRPEPLVAFALSCGAWSSPAVRIYTPENVHLQLQAALQDYVRASVCISRQGKLLVPKLLHCYVRDLNVLPATGEAGDGRAVALWLCTFLPTHQAAMVRVAVQQRSSCSSSSACVTIQPFNVHLRYLFLQ